MKRRTFIQTILAIIPFLPAKTLYADIDKAKQFAESMAETRKTIAINVPPRTPEGATKYISGLYRKSDIRFTPGRRGDMTLSNLVAVSTDHYTISGEGKTKEAAWANFWRDFHTTTSLDLFYNAYSKKDIFWRREVEEDSITGFDDLLQYPTKDMVYSVSCRFSLGDIA